MEVNGYKIEPGADLYRALLVRVTESADREASAVMGQVLARRKSAH